MGQPGQVGASDDGADFSLARSLAEAAGRRRRRRVVAAAVGLTATAAILVVASLPTAGNRGAAPAAPPGDGAHKAVAAALDQASARRTADVAMHMTIESGNQLFTIIGSGVMDIDSQAAEFGLSVTDGSGTLEMKIIYDGNRAYEAIPQLPRLEPGKYWVSFDPADPSNGSGGEPSALGVGGDPLTLLSLLQIPSTSVRELATAGGAGTHETEYLVTISPGDIRDLAGRGLLPQPLRPLARAPVSSLSAQVYLDRTGRLKSDSFTIGLNATVPVTMTDYLDFSNFGTSINVDAPPPSTVITYQQLIQDLGKRQGLII